MREKKKLIGELLVEEGIVEPEHVQAALALQKESGGKLVQNLIKLGHLDVEQVARFLSSRPGVPSIDLANYKISNEICELIPADYARKNEIFPIDRLGKLLTVGMAFPLDKRTIQEMETMTGLRVKAVLCSPKDIHTAIDEFYGTAGTQVEVSDAQRESNQLETSIKLQNVAQLIQEIDSLPALPDTVQRVRELTEESAADAKEIAGIIERDPAMAANVLQLANSAAYGFAHRIDNVARAISMLGFRETNMVVLSASVIDLVSNAEGFDYKRYWQDSMFCATAARRIARTMRSQAIAGIFTAALLHDIGRFAMSVILPDRYAKLTYELHDETLLAAEEQALGIAHPEAGYILAEHWNLPPHICESIRFHHRPRQATEAQEAVAIVSLAAFLTDHRSEASVQDGEISSHCESILGLVQLDIAQAEQVFRETKAQLAAG